MCAAFLPAACDRPQDLSTDEAGAADPGDTTAPTVTITSPGGGQAVGGDATLQFSVDEPASTIECSFDGGEPSACGAGTRGAIPIPASLGAGAHTAAVRATDLAGNVGAPAGVAFSVAAPALVVTIAPRGSDCPGEGIRFSASLPDATFACDLDGVVSAACASPFTLPSSLAAGTHSFTVTASAERAVGSSSLSFSVDPSRPEIELIATIPSPDAALKVDPSGLIFFRTSKRVTARCAVDAAEPVDCTSPDLEGLFTYTDLDERATPHRFRLAVTDACGNTASSTLPLDVDSTPPAPCFTAGKGACLDAPPTTGGEGSLTFAAEPGSYLCSVTTAVPAGSVVPPAATPPLDTRFDCGPDRPLAFSGHVDFGDAPHPYALVVEGIDLHGNPSRTTLSWLLDD